MVISDTWLRLVCHLFCSYHVDFDGICERNHIFITNPCLFWPIPRVLVSQTKRNTQGHHSSGVVKKRVRFRSGREKKKVITQHDPHLPRFFTPLLLSPSSIWHYLSPTEFQEQPMLILPNLLAPFLLYIVCPKEAIPLSGSGKISSTNYPKSNYTASRNCTWNITAPADKIIMFTFTDFVLSECSASPCSDSCSYVELYDGGSTSSPSLGRFCQGSSWNEPQLSTRNQMFVMFHPGQKVDRGFEAKYESTMAGGEYPVNSILNILFYKHQIFLCAKLVSTRYETDHAPSFNLFHTSTFLGDRQTFAAHHDHSKLLSLSFERASV